MPEPTPRAGSSGHGTIPGSDSAMATNAPRKSVPGRDPAALQVPSPKVAATFNMGGTVCASVCTVLRRA